ncbi:MAG: UDP-GlcNAc:undecaprenyl-phosphate/decaprenyl-phosphate GlcNAc-phosphate transferase [Thermoleophilaceae bacterium]|jgi:UDP-GlcNAc:undecaprenyl-phosphate GlcNAc-1-phosphate transferase|nr:UDP-GlcNAc:undecaprenyl-phosphate/decaprenyl-phosphate GlcNAc-phosphate transferase [Thermoleophilaceae bacterium]
MIDTKDTILAPGLALMVALLATPIAGRLAWKINAIDMPRARGLHQMPTPRLGGLAILLAVATSSLVFLPHERQMTGILVGATVIAIVGAIDDGKELTAEFKLVGQILAAAIPVAAGVRVESMTLPFLGHISLSPALAYGLTILGLVILMNIVNFIDGVDGLAAGVCTIAAATFATISLSLDREVAGVLALIVAAATLGYLRHGFAPASIFLGDSGSNLLGFLLGTIVIQGALKTNAVVALVFPLVVLAVPIFDTGYVIAKRIKYKRPVYKADKAHLHHRFARIGFSARRTALYLYGWTLTLAALALALRFVPYSDDHGHFHWNWVAVLAGFGVLAAAASVYLVLVLEILKLKRWREFQLRRASALAGEPIPADAEVREQVERELETGEFPAVRHLEAGESAPPAGRRRR